MKKLFIFSLFAALVLSLGSPALFAQGSGKNQVWTGIVVDANGEPIIGAAVLIAGKANTGSITEIDGTYSISAAADDELIFSCLGYQNETF